MSPAIIINDEYYFKLWVIKFCLKIIYPKLNIGLFLTYLAIKSRICYNKIKSDNIVMNEHMFKPISSNVQRLFIGTSGDNTPLYGNKCVIISKSKFIEYASENLFFLDRGILWMTITLSNQFKKRYLKRNNNKSYSKYDINHVTMEMHKKLWGKRSDPGGKMRVVPVISSDVVHDDMVLLTEMEFHNIKQSFSVHNLGDIYISFKSIPCFDKAPKIAAIAEVNLVANDYDLSTDFIKEILTNYFETPKLLSPFDLFHIKLTPEITGSYHYKYHDVVQSLGYLYFHCKKINSGTEDSESQSNRNSNVEGVFFIIKGVTQLTLGENIHTMRPKDSFFPLNIKSEAKWCPKGLWSKFELLNDTIAPFLHENYSDLFSSLTSPIIPMLLLTGAIGSGRHIIVKSLAKYNGVNCIQIDCNALQSSTAKQTESKINAMIQRAKAASPCIILMDNFEVFAVDAEDNEDIRVIEYFVNTITTLYQNYTKHSIIFIAVTERQNLKPNIVRIFLDRIHIPKLNIEERYELLQWFVSVMNVNIQEYTQNKNVSKANDVLHKVAAKTETFSYGEIDALMHFTLRESFLKTQVNLNESSPDPILNSIQENSFMSALESMRNLQSQHLDAPKIPKVYWEDIGGLEKLKKELLKTIEFPIKYPHLFKNSSIKRSGILLYGPPGCGKTLVAKAVCTELNVSFLSVKGPELLNMYIGQSEENVRKVFESARRSSPCIVFLDELDALAARRGAAGDSGGAGDRLVSQLLAEVDGVAAPEDSDKSSFVFIMGATNRPDLLEQSLLRPGRLDKLIYVGPYSGLEEKTKVLNALCRRHKLRPEVQLSSVAEALPERCTGADLLQVVDNARTAAVRGVVASLKNGTIRENDLSTDSVVIGVTEFLEGVKSFRPSVLNEELAHYESLKTYV